MNHPALLPGDAHDALLAERVHPAAHQNPAPRPRYDLVVVGGGTGGLVSAIGAAGLGARVALVERHLLGGDCLNTGCVPSKALLRAARAASDVRSAGSFGVRAGAPEVDFPAVMERLRGLRADIARNDSARRVQDAGVELFLGEARFLSPDALEVGGATLRFGKAILATGGRPALPPLPGLAEAGILTSENVFALTALPRRLSVLGAGPIGCELAQAFARLGVEVTLFGREPRLLPREDDDAAEIVARSLSRDGVRLRLGEDVQRVEPDRTLVLASGERVAADALLVAVGRRPNVEGLDLARAGIAVGPRGVAVDERLRTTNRRVYAVGDVAGSWQFTHAADAMARLALQNALFFGRKRASALTMPWCTYTDPEVAHVGLSAREARARGPSVQTFTVPLAEVDRALLDGASDGFARIHVGPRGRLVGATLVSAHAGESIGELSLAIASGLGVAALAATIHPYPTQAEAFRRCADAWSRTRLTPRTRGLLRAIARWP